MSLQTCSGSSRRRRPGIIKNKPSGGPVVQLNVMECPFQAKSAGCTAPQSRATRHLDTRADYSARPRVATRGRGSTRARSGPAGVSLLFLLSLDILELDPRGPRRTRGRCLRDIASSPVRRRGDGVFAWCRGGGVLVETTVDDNAHRVAAMAYERSQTPRCG